MYMKDFTYAGARLSDFGCIIANAVTGNSESISLGSNLSFDTLRHKQTFENGIVKAKYEENISVTFDIIKFSCKEYVEEFTGEEISYIMKWLNRKTYEKFYPEYDDGSYPNIYFNGTFNVTAISIGGKVIGFTLTFNSNSPFGYIDKELVADVDSSLIIYNDSDEIGYLYPRNFEITCNKTGDLEVSNEADPDNVIMVKNCVAGEVITFDCVNKIIVSSETHTRLYNDFNYNYPRLIQDEFNLGHYRNTLSFSLPCSVKIKYAAVIKTGIVV